MKKEKVLFILKKRQVYNDNQYSSVNSGLYNSANFVHKMLLKNGVNSTLVEVTDNNDIDREVTEYKPTTVIIEALWVVPEKFEVLQKLHPNVKWIIRLHSEIPFIANEGIAVEWLKGYTKYDNVKIASNSKMFVTSMKHILKKDIIYMPNYYEVTYPAIEQINRPQTDIINIGLFGAIRPMKNALTQAVAAMIYADENNLKLHLHINTARIEQRGENTLKNVKALFEGTEHKLIEHDWLKHEDFIQLVKTMDIGLQVSLSETYNIVSADFVNQEVPIITSKEVPFVYYPSTVNIPKDALEIVNKIEYTLKNKRSIIHMNKVMLAINSKLAQEEWIKLFK